MIVELMTSKEHFTEMERTAAEATLTCHANVEKMSAEGYKPSDTLKNIIKWGHESVLEHINLSFQVKDLSRACLQELARHRFISLSVKSTRHTLKKTLQQDYIKILGSKFILHHETTQKTFRPEEAITTILIDLVREYPDIKNDELKYFLPEFWPTNLVMTVNIRELRHIIKVRTHPAALEEFRELARKLYEVVPTKFKYLLEDCLYKKAENRRANDEQK